MERGWADPLGSKLMAMCPKKEAPPRGLLFYVLQFRPMRKGYLQPIVFLLLSGCVLSAPPPRNSRYVADITSLEKSAVYKDTWVYRHPTKRVVDYNAFILPPVTVYRNPAEKIADRAVFDKMEVKFSDRMLKMMRKDYAVVENPGEGTLVIKISVVDIKPVVETVDEAGNKAIRLMPDTKGSKIEVDCHDSVTNEQIFAMSNLYKGEEYMAFKDLKRAFSVDKAFQEWSKFFKMKFDEAMKQKQISR